MVNQKRFKALEEEKKTRDRNEQNLENLTLKIASGHIICSLFQ